MQTATHDMGLWGGCITQTRLRGMGNFGMQATWAASLCAYRLLSP